VQSIGNVTSCYEISAL